MLRRPWDRAVRRDSVHRTVAGCGRNPNQSRDPNEIERGVATLAQFANGGLILTASPTAPVHRDLIIALAARHKLPAVYVERLFAAAGGLVSYGPDFVDQYRRAAGYVDRILRGRSQPTCRCRRPPSTSW